MNEWGKYRMFEEVEAISETKDLVDGECSECHQRDHPLMACPALCGLFQDESCFNSGEYGHYFFTPADCKFDTLELDAWEYDPTAFREQVFTACVANAAARTGGP